MSPRIKYTEELADKICDEIASSSRGLAFICAKLNVSPSTVFKWLSEHKDFAERYARAREAQADYMADEILEIADDDAHDTIRTEKGDIENKEWVNRSRLKVEARKWVASKLKPKKYGDKLDLTSGGDKLAPVIIDWAGTHDNKPDTQTEGGA